MAAARALGVEGVDRAALHRRRPCSRRSPLSFSVSVWIITCTSIVVGDRQAAVDGGRAWCPSPRAASAQAAPACTCSSSASGRLALPLPAKAEVHREGVGRLQHPPDVPGPRRAGGGQRAVRRAGAAAEHRGDARMQRVLDLLRADEVDVAVDAARGQDLALARDDLGPRPDDDVDAGLGVGVAGLADLVDAPVAQADVGLVDAGPVDDQRVGDDGVDRAAPRGVAWLWPMPSRITLPPPNFTSSP